VPIVVPLLLKVCAILVPQAEAQSDPPLIPLPCDTVHVKVLPDTLLVSEMPVEVPLQMDALEGLAVATGLGFTVTSTVNAVPAQPVAVGVTVYLTTPFVVPVLVSV